MKFKRLAAIATTFAMALGAIGISGFTSSWKAFADENPSLGGENGDMLYDLTISKDHSVTVNLTGPYTGNYFTVVSVYDETYGEGGATITGALDSSAAVTMPYRSEFYGYTYEFNFTDAKTLTIATDVATELNIGLAVYAAKENVGTLPTAATSFELYTTYTYSYNVKTAGFYSINNKSVYVEGHDDLQAFYSIAVKVDPNYLEATYVSENNTPIYLNAGVIYFDIVFTDASYMVGEEYVTPAAVMALFAVEKYNDAAVEIEPDGFYTLPVELTARNFTLVNVTGEYYKVTVLDIPEGESVTLEFDNGRKATFTNSNEQTLNLTGATKVTLTASAPFVVGFFMQETNVINMNLNEETKITLEPYASQEFAVKLTEGAGVYTVKLSEKNMNVEVSYPNGVAVSARNDVGYFIVFEKNLPDDVEVVISFLNVGYSVDDEGNIIPDDTTYTFSAIVEKAQETELDKATSISLNAGETKILYLELPSGDYTIQLSKVGISIVLGGDLIVDPENNFGEFSVNFGLLDSYYVVLEITSEAEYSGTITVR